MILLAERADQAFMADRNGQLSGNIRSSNFGRGFSRGFGRSLEMDNVGIFVVVNNSSRM